MKKILIIVTCCMCFALATTNAKAQNSTTPVAKIAPDENALKPDPKNLTTSKIEEPSKPAALPFQRSETPQQVTAAEQSKSTMPGQNNNNNNNTFSNNAPKPQPQILQNNDRPKPSTIQVSKNVDPVKPTPKIANPIN